MKHEENNRNNYTPDTSDFLHNEKDADQLFQDILKGLDMDSSYVPHSHHLKYRSRFFCRCALKGILAVAAIGLFTVGGTGFFQKPSISSVKAAPSSDSSSARITFSVDALFPVSKVSATLNESEVSVDTDGNQSYSIEVQENGYLLLDVVSISGVHATQGITIDSIDDQAPVILSHSHEDDKILIYAKDIGDSGIDYNGIYASTYSSGKVRPNSYDPGTGLIVFPYPNEDMYIMIPDKNGNKLISVLKPGLTSDSGTQ